MSSEASTSSTSKEQASDAGSIRQVGGSEAKELVESGALLLDVRTPREFSNGHPQEAKNIPVSELASRVNELDASRPVVVYCRSGRRSHKAAVLLERRGFEVADLGSVSDWPE